MDQLRVTDGVEAAVFLYEAPEGKCKVSMRANGSVDVSRIAREFGGGGHVKAAGCTVSGGWREIIDQIAGRIAEQLEH